MCVWVDDTGKSSDQHSESDSVMIPTSIFLDRNVAVLEAIVEFLKEQHELNYAQIGRLMNREQRNIRTVYLRAKAKRSLAPVLAADTPTFPLSVVTDRHVSIFESIIKYLRTHGFANKDIAALFARSTKTISTVYNRAMRKDHE